jgi:hypothetical protein
MMQSSTFNFVLCALNLFLGQAPPAPRPPTAETVFTNIQVLKGIPVNQFLETMGIFTASLGVGCDYCHIAEAGGNWGRYADDNGPKRTARRMVMMVSAINRDNFGTRQVVTCYTCHRGGNRPRVTPSLALLYGASPPEDPDDLVAPGPGAPSADRVLDKYIAALGGAARLTAITSVAATGTYQGYGDPAKRTVDVFARSPRQRATIVHAPDGDSRTIYDGREGWIAAPITERPLPIIELTGSDLDAARVDAELSFPGRIKQVFAQWRAGAAATIDDREVQVVQGSNPGKVPATFFFDKESGLLVRVVRYADSPVGRIPMQTDYADYRDVSGVKVPFHWTSTWLDGRSTVELIDVKVNVPIPPSTFTKPVR